MDYRALYASIYDRAAVGSPGTALRALVGSIFRAKTPLNFNGKTLNYLMWRDGGVGGQSGAMRPVAGAWWIYIPPTEDSRTLWRISGELETLYGYTSRHAIARMRTSVVFIGQPFYDDKLKLQGQEVRIQHDDR